MKTIRLYFLSLILTLVFTFPVFKVVAKKWVVTVQNYSFFPYNLTHVKAGDTIQFQWVEGVHTTTSTSIPQDALEWDYPITQQEPSAIVIPMVNGTYKYVSTTDASRGMDGTFTVTGALGMSSPGEMPDIRLFPNPAAEQINVLTTIDNIDFLRIFDMNGKMVDELSFGKLHWLSFRTIDLRNYPSGVFFFEFTLESNKKKVVRLVHTGN
jgi:plastocyanin